MTLTDGLSGSFLAGRTRNGQRDMTIAEIARRFNHTTNGDVSTTERWGMANNLRRDHSLPDLLWHDQSVNRAGRHDTDTAFTSTLAEQTLNNPTILYAYEWAYCSQLRPERDALRLSMGWRGVVG
ncbi:MAG: hypothetical protein R2867_22160 [Caldilineaceae bacterium]